jgi:hypothetical protein
LELQLEELYHCNLKHFSGSKIFCAFAPEGQSMVAAKTEAERQGHSVNHLHHLIVVDEYRETGWQHE